MLTILSVAYPFAPVGPDAVGGAEQVLTAIDRALVTAGHHSVVIACAGSTVAGTLVELPPPRAPIDDAAYAAACTTVRDAIDAALHRWPIDLVHMHGVDFAAYLPSPGVPVLVTLHLPVQRYGEAAFEISRPGTFLHCVSGSQHATFPIGARLLPPIENGVAIRDLRRTGLRRADFAIALGRVCPEKGFDLALDASRLADVPLFVAGRVFPYPEHERYFRDELLPRMDRRRRFIGPAGMTRKRRLLNGSRCLLVTSRAPETSSLVAMEALACGTPVIARPVGALADIVQDGSTGILADSVREFAHAIRRVECIDRSRCIAAALERFGDERMTRAYIDRYRELAGRPAAMPVSARRVGTIDDPGGPVAPPPPPRHADTLEQPDASAAPPPDTTEHPQGPAARSAPRPRVDIIDSSRALEELAREWHLLWHRSRAATPFQHPAWLLPWWRHWGGRGPRVIAVRQRGRLAAIAPMYLHRHDTHRTLLVPFGYGNTDYTGPVIDSAAAPGTTAALVDAMLEAGRDADCIALPALHTPDRHLLNALAACPRAGTTHAAYPVLSLHDVDGDLPAAVPARMRSRFASCLRRLERMGDVQLQEAAAGTIDDLMHALFELHGARWARRGEDGVLSDDLTRSFHLNAAPALLDAGLLRLLALRLDGRIMAIMHVLFAHRRACYYISGFDPRFARFSPGVVITGMAIQRAVAEGMAEFDFLAGREPYKYAWGAVDRPVAAISIPRAEEHHVA